MSVVQLLSLVDTNVFVHYVRNDGVMQRIEAKYGLLSMATTPLYSQIVEAEVLSLSVQFGWGQAKQSALGALFVQWQRVALDVPGITAAYVALDNYSLHHGRKMGKNDLWIAATANATGATLLTTDKDFDHLDPLFIRRIWIDPAI